MVMMKRIASWLSVLLLVALLVTVAWSDQAWAATDRSSVEQSMQALGILSADENGNLNLGSQVTRAEFAKMLVMASSYRNGVSDQSGISPFSDVKYTHWAAEYIKIAVDEGWMTGYVDGSFRPENTVLLEEAATSVLKMLGYSSSDLMGTYPSAQMSKYRALSLNNNISKGQGQTITRSDCMYLFYNMMGATTSAGGVYATTIGFSVASSGELDYADLINNETQGPFINEGSWTGNIPFSTSTATIYRNNKIAEASEISLYDVYYYSENLKTIWVYNEQITGLYTAATPNTTSPTAVTVAGNTYQIGSSSAAYQLSSAGSYQLGDVVTLLLGMNGDVVGVLEADTVEGIHYGVVIANGTETYDTGAATVQSQNIVSVACTDGVVRQYASTNTNLTVGTVVSATYRNGKFSVLRLSSKGFYGVVNAEGTATDNYKLAGDVQILDTTSQGAYGVIYASRLAGQTLRTSDIRYYVLNSKDEISHLILNDFTGDIHSYGIITEATSAENSSSGSYQHVIEGQNGVTSSSNAAFSVEKGAAVFQYGVNSIYNIKNLEEVKLNSVNALKATGDGKEYQVSDQVQIYLYKRGEYYLTSLGEVSDSGLYTLTGYYDKDFQGGGYIRVIIATEKQAN